jgi:hypothetical protein
LRRRYDEIASVSGGIGWLATFRPLDEASTGLFICLMRAADREAYNALIESAAMSTYRGGLPQGAYETLSAECYEIAHEVLPASTREAP